MKYIADPADLDEKPYVGPRGDRFYTVSVIQDDGFGEEVCLVQRPTHKAAAMAAKKIAEILSAHGGKID